MKKSTSQKLQNLRLQKKEDQRFMPPINTMTTKDIFTPSNTSLLSKDKPKVVVPASDQKILEESQSRVMSDQSKKVLSVKKDKHGHDHGGKPCTGHLLEKLKEGM